MYILFIYIIIFNYMIYFIIISNYVYTTEIHNQNTLYWKLHKSELFGCIHIQMLCNPPNKHVLLYGFPLQAPIPRTHAFITRNPIDFTLYAGTYTHTRAHITAVLCTRNYKTEPRHTNIKLDMLIGRHHFFSFFVWSTIRRRTIA